MKRRIQVGRRAAVIELEVGGAVGRGEIAPLPGYSTETLAEAVSAARELPLPDPERLSIDRVRAAVAPLIERAPSAAFGIETALLELGAAAKEPRSGAAGSRRPIELPGPVRPIEINALVASISEADVAFASGVRAFKVKVGRDFRRALDLLLSLRRCYGQDATLRVDANGAWSIREARARIDQLAALDLEYIEEPSPWPAPLELAGLGVPLALDESLRVDAAARLAAMGSRLGFVVLKPASLGGVLRCLELARMTGAEPIVTHMRGGPIELIRCWHLARALGVRRACGLDAHPELADWRDGAVP